MKNFFNITRKAAKNRKEPQRITRMGNCCCMFAEDENDKKNEEACEIILPGRILRTRRARDNLCYTCEYDTRSRILYVSDITLHDMESKHVSYLLNRSLYVSRESTCDAMIDKIGDELYEETYGNCKDDFAFSRDDCVEGSNQDLCLGGTNRT